MRTDMRTTTTTQWPPRNETSTDRQGKISHLLKIILNNCDTLNDFEREFTDKMGGLLNRRSGIEPATALSEKQARTLRKIIFRRYRDYKHAVPDLPTGVKFEDEVRRLLKSQPNPNEARNELIEKAKGIMEKEIKREERLSNRAYKMDGGTQFAFSEPMYKEIVNENILFSFIQSPIDSISIEPSFIYIYAVDISTEKATHVSSGIYWES